MYFYNKMKTKFPHLKMKTKFPHFHEHRQQRPVNATNVETRQPAQWTTLAYGYLIERNVAMTVCLVMRIINCSLNGHGHLDWSNSYVFYSYAVNIFCVENFPNAALADSNCQPTIWWSATTVCTALNLFMCSLWKCRLCPWNTCFSERGKLAI